MGKINGILGDNIRALRRGKGWTQVYLADRLQITPSFLAQIESGKRGTSLETIETIAELFDIPIASLFLDQPAARAEARPGVRRMELEAVERQLLEDVAGTIMEAFRKLE